MSALKELIAAALKERFPDRAYWFDQGKASDVEPKRLTVAGYGEAMYFASEEADLAVGLLDGLGNAPCRVALGALREGVKSKIYSAYVKRIAREKNT